MDNTIVEQKGRVALIRLNRPDKLNALSTDLFTELNAAIDEAEKNDDTGAIVIIGVGRAFAVGVDISEIVQLSAHAADSPELKALGNMWERTFHCEKPTIAAVGGVALGGGCELAMMCDMIIAVDNAKFAQPEINLGIIPGIGGTQRLTRAIGKAKAMEMILTGRMMDAVSAEAAGLITRLVAADKLEAEALNLAAAIAAQSLPIVRAAKKAVNAAFNTTLESGLQVERRLFHATADYVDRHEGLSAFLEKRKPVFKHE